MVFEDESESSPHQTQIVSKPLPNNSATVNMVSHSGGDDVIPYVPLSVSLDKSTSGSVDPSFSQGSADPGLFRVYDILRSAELL